MVGSNQKERFSDTGATWNICSNYELFTTFKTIDCEKMWMGNYAQSAIQGMSKVAMKMISEKKLTLNNVLCVRSVQELISRSLLNKHGFIWCSSMTK